MCVCGHDQADHPTGRCVRPDCHGCATYTEEEK